MRVRALMVGLAVVLLAMVAAPSSPAATTVRRVTKTYTAGGNDAVLVSAVGQWATGVGIEREAACAGVGGACFGLKPGETRLRVRIVDANGGPTAGAASFADARGRTMPTGWLSFCETTGLAIPEGAAVAVVTVGAVISCSASHFGTTGTVTAAIR